jgi:cell division transport system permease protein
MLAVFARDAVRGIRRAPGPAALCTLAVAVALVLPELLALLYTNYDRLRDAALGDARVVAFVRADAPAAELDALATAVAARPGATGARLIPASEVAAWMAAQYSDLAGLAPAEADALFPPVLEVTVRRDVAPAARDDLAAALRASPLVEDADPGTRTLARLEAVARAARHAGIAAGAVLAALALLGIGAAVRLSVYARRDEIEILRLVGATRTFVRAPFLLEGLLLGAAGAAVSLVVAWGAFTALGPSGGVVSLPFGGLSVAFLPFGAVGALAGAGALLGLAGSAIGVARHLRET